MNLLYRMTPSYTQAERFSHGVGSSIKKKVDSTRFGPPGAKNSSATVPVADNTNPFLFSFTEAGIEGRESTCSARMPNRKWVTKIVKEEKKGFSFREERIPL